MNIGELKEMLEGVDDNVEVRIATQPNYPLEFGVSSADLYEAECDEDDDSTEVEINEAKADPIFYIAEGNSEGYLASSVARSLGWR